MRLTTLTALVLAAALGLSAACKQEAEEATKSAGSNAHADHAPTGPNGGVYVEIAAGHLECLHDEFEGTFTIFLTGADAKTPLTIDKPPVLKLITEDGPKVIPTTAAAGAERGARFSAKHAALERHVLEGRISVEVDGKTYNPDIADAHHHHHDDDPKDHDGKDSDPKGHHGSEDKDPRKN